MHPLVLLTAVLWMQPHRIDLNAPPWGQVLDIMVQDPPDGGSDAARRYLEGVARSPRPGWERAHAWVWAGRLAYREHLWDAADRDFRAAVTADPGGVDARWGSLGAADTAIATHRIVTAERLLAPLVTDPDPGVRVYATVREQVIRGQLRKPWLRRGSVAVAVLAWTVALALAWRRSAGAAVRFGRALLVTESLAVASALVVKARATPLAQPGWMAAAIPGAVLMSVAWTARPPRGHWPRALGLALLVALGCAGMLYTALDVTWWSVQ